MNDGFEDIRAIANQEITEALAAVQSRDFDRAVKLLKITIKAASDRERPGRARHRTGIAIQVSSTVEVIDRFAFSTPPPI